MTNIFKDYFNMTCLSLLAKPVVGETPCYITVGHLLGACSFLGSCHGP